MKKLNKNLENFAQMLLKPLFVMGILGIIMTFLAMMMNIQTLKPLALLLYQSLSLYVLPNISILFLLGIVAFYLEDDHVESMFIAFFAYLVFLGTHHLFLGEALLKQKILGIEVSQMGLFPVVVLGFFLAKLISKTKDIQFHPYLRPFEGLAFSTILSFLLAALFGFSTAKLWPILQVQIIKVSEFLLRGASISAFAYGFLNKLLLPFGLHHLLWIPIQWGSIGGTFTSDTLAYQGAYSIWLAQLSQVHDIQSFHPSLQYLRDFSYLALPIGAALAIYHTSSDRDRKELKKDLLPAVFSASLAGVTEPIEFLFLAKSKNLWLVHASLSGLGFALAEVLQVQMEISTLPPLVMNILLLPPRLSKPFRFLLILLILILLEYLLFIWIIRKDQISFAKTVDMEKDTNYDRLLAALGGKQNIKHLGNCYTRLRIEVYDEEKIDPLILKSLPSKGFVQKDNHVQIVIGTRVQEVRESLEKHLK